MQRPAKPWTPVRFRPQPPTRDVLTALKVMDSIPLLGERMDPIATARVPIPLWDCALTSPKLRKPPLSSVRFAKKAQGKPPECMVDAVIGFVLAGLKSRALLVSSRTYLGL